MTTNAISYSDAGVNIDAGEDAVHKMIPIAKATQGPNVLGGVGGFAALFRLKEACEKMTDPVLVSGTDGVGTKLLVAIKANKHEWVGQDLVAMCANDVLTVGAKPLFFLDYFASAKIKDGPLLQVVQSIGAACKQIGCALVGGETAEMPGMYEASHYDLAGFCVGVVDRQNIVDGKNVKPGDHIIGLASNGLHSNGFSLARKIVFERMSLSVEQASDLLLPPTTLYVNPILHLLRNQIPIKAMAHITGGGIPGNIARQFPAGLTARITYGTWGIPKVFALLREKGPVLDEEMEKTFNLGIGFALVVPPHVSQDVMSQLASLGEKSFCIGEVVEGNAVQMVRVI